MRRRINYKFVAGLLLSLAVMAVGGHFLHAYQVKRNASSLLRRANEAEGNKDVLKALDYLGRYLAFRPDDTEALIKYALLLEQNTRVPRARVRAFLVLNEAVLRAPERQDARRRLIAVAMDVGRFGEARESLGVLLESSPDDAELEVLLGRCEEKSNQFAKAAEWYDKAIRHDPRRADGYVQLAEVYRGRLERPLDADAVMEQLVKVNPESVQARLARGRYLRKLGLLGEANREISYVREKLAPEEADMLLASADLAQADGKRDEVRRYLEQGLTKHREDVRFHLGLAGLDLQEGHQAEAVRRLREAVKVLPDQAALIWTAADLLIDAGEPKDAEELLKRLAEADYPAPAVGYLRARMAFNEGHFAAARDLLEKQRPELARSPDLAVQADVLLGMCHERLHNPEEQLAAYRRATTEGPPSVPARLGLASALLANGQLDEALTEYRKLMPSVPELRFTVGRLLILRTLRLPAGQQSWEPVELLLKEAPEKARDTTDYQLLGIELLALRGRLKEAREAVRAACEKNPKELRYWAARAALADREPPAEGDGPFAASLRVLDEAEKQLGDRTELRLERAGRLARMPAESAREALRKLESIPDGLGEAEQANLRIGLALAYDRLGDRDSSRRLLRQAAGQLPGDLRVRERLFGLELAAGDDAAAQRVRDEMRALEGPNGTLWRGAEAVRLVARARRGDAAGLAEARRLLADLAKVRPGWSRRALLAATIDDLEGNVEAAIDGYRQAIDLGERAPETVQRAVRLLMARRRTEEAKLLLDKVREQVAAVPELGRDAARLSLLSQDPQEHTLELVGRAVSRDSKDYRDHLFLGQVLWVIGKPREAEEALRQVVALQPKAPEAWIALVGFLADADRKKEAEEEIARAKAAIPPADAPLALATCCEVVGQRDKAEEHHLAVLKGGQGDAGALRVVAAFYLRGGDVAKAEPYLRRMVGAGGVPAAWARRSLALSLTTTGDYQQTREALALLDENLRLRPGDPDDQRARALVLAQRPGGRREAIQVLEGSFARLRAAPVEQFLLARLYEADRNWPRAKEVLLSLVGSKGGDNPAYVAYYVAALLRHDSADEAANWLRRLEEKAKDSPLTLEAKVRVLAAQGKGAEAAALLGKWARDEYAAKKEPLILKGSAVLLEQLSLPDEAEKLFREYAAAAEDKRPESSLMLAQFLARRNRLSEALDVCERAAEKCPPEAVALVSTSALRFGQPGPGDYRRVERWLEAVIRRKPGSARLLVSLADLRDVEGRTEDAEAAYRASLAKEPNAMAMNNLAWLLAMNDGKKGEALELVTRAIETGGPLASRLDTRGVIRLMMGQNDEAIKDLEEAAAEGPTDAVYFHLARAHLQAGNRVAAERAWETARELKLTEKSLHRLEREEYGRLEAALRPK